MYRKGLRPKETIGVNKNGVKTLRIIFRRLRALLRSPERFSVLRTLSARRGGAAIQLGPEVRRRDHMQRRLLLLLLLIRPSPECRTVLTETGSGGTSCIIVQRGGASKDECPRVHRRGGSEPGFDSTSDDARPRGHRDAV